MPVITDQGGNDRWILYGTYINVKSLYEKAIHSPLKAEDKDTYLVDKFIDNNKWHTGGFIGSLLTDRMIAAIFLKISSKK